MFTGSGSVPLLKCSTYGWAAQHCEHSFSLFSTCVCRSLASLCAACEQGLCRPQLSVITGRGNHSQGGVARIRPAVIDYLTNRHYRYSHKHTHRNKLRTRAWRRHPHPPLLLSLHLLGSLSQSLASCWSLWSKKLLYWIHRAMEENNSLSVSQSFSHKKEEFSHLGYQNVHYIYFIVWLALQKDLNDFF